MVATGTVAFLALKQISEQDFDRDADKGLLIKLLDSFGAPHPQLDAAHYLGDIGKYCLKWEKHTEFLTYTLFWAGLSERPFDPVKFEAYPPIGFLKLNICGLHQLSFELNRVRLKKIFQKRYKTGLCRKALFKVQCWIVPS